MKKKNVFAVLMAVAVLVTCFAMQTLSVSAAGEGQEIAYTEKESTEVIADFTDMTKITGTWDGGKTRVFDGNKLVISNDVCGNITGLKVTGVEPGVYKVGYFLDIQAIKDSDNPPEGVSGMQDWRFRINPLNAYLNMPYYDCTFDVWEFEGLSNVVGQKIIAVVVINVEDTTDIELLAWPKDGYMDATLDRIVFAGADHDFGPANYADYTIFIEQAAHEASEEKIPYEDDWTESNLVAPTPTPEETATPEATVEATPEATVETTPEATEEATPEATVEATEAPATSAPAASATQTSDADDTPKNDSTMVIVIVVIVVAVIAAAVVVFLVMKKKKG